MGRIEALLRADTFDTWIARLEAFSDHFEHLATTADQRELAAQFHAFVDETVRACYPSREWADHHPEAISEKERFLKEHGHESLADLFKEIRTDEAAGKRVDAHYCRKEAIQKLLDGKANTPAVETTNDIEMER